jgi:hypothetical protein
LDITKSRLSLCLWACGDGGTARIGRVKAARSSSNVSRETARFTTPEFLFAAQSENRSHFSDCA